MAEIFRPGGEAGWHTLNEAKLRQLPYPLLQTLGMEQGSWIAANDLGTEYVQMPSIDMEQCMKAFASLGRCSVFTALYMCGVLKQLHYRKDEVRIVKRRGRVQVLGRPEAGYYHLLSDSFVVPHQFNLWWRLQHRVVLPLAVNVIRREVVDDVEAFAHGAVLMPPVQNLAVDGDGIAPGLEPPSAQRPWLPHQIRSFRWMVYREAVRDLFVCESMTALPAGLDKLDIEYKCDKAFDLRGGVLCDPVGSGKTATMLGLILHDRFTDEWSCEVQDAVSSLFSESWLTANATLVLCPDHVHDQWVNEVDRALEFGAVDVTAVRTVNELRALAPKLRALTEDSTTEKAPQVVIVANSVVQDTEYAKLISPANKDLKEWLAGSEKWDQGLALDCFVWRRFIIDEVHEVVHVCDPRKCGEKCARAALLGHLRGLKSERRWGLTGTAQEVLRDARSVQYLAQVFRTDFNSEVSSQRFVEHYCRTNQVDVAVRVSERMEVIEHAPVEKFIYRQQARDFHTLGMDGTGEHPLSPDELTATIPLLKLCSHFNVGDFSDPGLLTSSEVAHEMHSSKQDAAKEAKAKVDVTGSEEGALMALEDTRPPIAEARNLGTDLAEGLWAEAQEHDGELKVVITRVEPFVAKKLPNIKADDMVTSIAGHHVFEFARRLHELRLALEATPLEMLLGTDEAPPEALAEELRNLKVRENLARAFRQELRDRAAWSEPKDKVSLVWRQMGAAVRWLESGSRGAAPESRLECTRSLIAKHRQWRDTEASFNFLHRLYESLCAHDRLPRPCPICLDEFDAAAGGVLLRCGHLYCKGCSKLMFGALKKLHSGRCPLCRMPVDTSMDVVDLEQFALARARKKEGAEGKHGSKLQRVAEVLRSILDTPAGERAIVFCQFADLEERISSALTDFGIAHVRLSTARDVFQQTAILDGFQRRRGRQRVLLLSLEQSASGTNLTAANHVLLVHPMAARTPERAVAFEQQAIGRCVRIGQKRQVTVWRFVTRDTVEEVLDQRLATLRQSKHAASAKRRPKRVRGGAEAAVSEPAEVEPEGSDVRTGSEPAGAARVAVEALRRHPAPRRSATDATGALRTGSGRRSSSGLGSDRSRERSGERRAGRASSAGAVRRDRGPGSGRSG